MSMVTQSSLQFGSAIILYSVRFAPRKTAAIEVHPDQQVTVIAPHGSEPPTIEALVRKRAPWILRQQRQFLTYTQPERSHAYVSGESYRYLGRQYRLKVREGKTEGVQQERGFLYVTVAEKQQGKQVQRVLEGWYRENAKRIFQQRLARCYPRVERLGVIYPTLTIRAMKTRWGSCGHSGVILLNPKLVQVPLSCIDYVIFHELCHLKEQNHGKHYYQLLDQVLPNWREKRQKLNQFELC
jgi:predicted metal-dependent hydrolase